MYQFSNRECFNGRYLIPVNQFNQHHHWPPSHVKCDCSELAEHQIRRNRGNFYPTYILECSSCKNKYQLIRGTRQFECLS
ncbi:hypothetical protein CV740_14800 [Enterococcus faecium]|nr:hypothetical protein CV740_14800 [Enterococcus faecium]HAQ7485169.1 hypothetical protein [Enterococcus faecium]